MSESNDMEEPLIEIKEMTIDQLAGAVVLFLGAVGSLLLVIWQSRCACKCRIGCSDKCYIFDCSREPPPPPEDKDKEKDEDEEAPEEDERNPSLTPNAIN
tara:strand:- start:322 stop:621 length:300 start_codon:yes stop_codon:yes gene_type:complete